MSHRYKRHNNSNIKITRQTFGPSAFTAEGPTNRFQSGTREIAPRRWREISGEYFCIVTAPPWGCTAVALCQLYLLIISNHIFTVAHDTHSANARPSASFLKTCFSQKCSTKISRSQAVLDSTQTQY